MFSYTGTAAVMFCIGTALGLIIQGSLPLIFLGIAVFIIAPCIFCLITYYASGRNVWMITVAGVFLFAGFWVTEYKTSYNTRPLYPFADTETELHGVVASVPLQNGDRYQFIMEVRNPAREKIRVSTDVSGLQPGDSIKTYGKLKAISSKANTTSFNRRNYYMRRGIYFSQFAEKILDSDKKYKMSLPCKISCFTEITAATYIKRFPEDVQPLLKGIILNNKTEIPDDVADNMLRSGAYRYIYSPYIHVTIILMLLGVCFGKQGRAMPFIIAILIIYLAMNSGVTVAWKIALFYVISNGIMFVRHKSNPRDALYLTVLVTGFLNPVTLTEPGFIISMVCTVLMRAFSCELKWRIFDVLKNHRVSQTLSTYLIITVGIYPVCSYFGYSLTLWSYFTGTLLIPAVSLVYIIFYGGFGIFALSGLSYTFGVPYIIRGFTKITEYAADLPFSSISPGNCGILFVITFYIFLYGVYRRVIGKKLIPVEVISAVLILICTVNTVSGINDAELTFINVGQADCAVIKLPRRHAIMIDGGGSAVYSDYDVGSAEVVPFLTANGITTLDSMVISHYDKDHTDGLLSVADIIKVKKIIMPDYEPDNDYRKLIENMAEEKGVDIILVKEPGKVDLSKNLEGEVIHFEKSDDGNDSSLVLRVTYGKTDILFTGDISMYTEYMLPKTPVEILKVPHHGSKTSSSTDLIQNTDADYNVISVGADNPYGHPAESVLERYNNARGKLLRTDLEGDIHFVIGKDKIKRVWSRSNIIIDK